MKMRWTGVLALMLLVVMTLPAFAAKKSVLEKGSEAYKDKKYTQAIQFYVKALKQKDTRDNPHALAYYNIACCYSLLHQSKPALTNLKKAVEKGYTNARWIRRDADFEFVRSADSVRFAETVNLAETLFKDERLKQSPIAVLSMDSYLGAFDVNSMQWDDPNGPEMTELRTTYKLDSVVAPGKTEFDKILLCLDWVHSRWEHSGDNECKENNALAILAGAAKGEKYRCVEYGVVTANCLTALGYPARVVGLQMEGVAYGTGKGHVIAEVWSNDYHKWIGLDGQNNAFWRANGQPLSAAECRDYFARGKDDSLEMAGLHQGWDYRALQAGWVSYFYHVSIGLSQIYFPKKDQPSEKRGPQYVLDGGLSVPELYFQGYPQSWRQVNDPDFLYPELNAVRVNLGHVNSTKPTDTLKVQLEHTMPFFDHYMVSINGSEWKKSDAELTWVLAPGENRIEVKAVNTRGIEGRSARVVLKNNLRKSA